MFLIQDMYKAKDFSIEVDECKEKMITIKSEVLQLHQEFISKYELVKEKIPLLKNAKKASSLI